MALANTARLSLIWTLDDQDHAVNVLHYDSNGDAINQTTANDLAVICEAALVTSNFEDTLANNFKLARITVRNLDVDNQPEYSAEVDHAGLVTADVLPLSTSLCITLRTALAGRRYRGRTYLTGFAEGSNSATGTCVAGSAENARSFIEDIHGDIALGAASLSPGDGLVVASFTGGFATPVTSIVVRDLVWDTQRRRAKPGI